MTNNQLTRERIELIANFHRAMTLPPSHDEIEELARMTLAAMDGEPNRNPVLAYADSYRDMAKQGVESVPIWSVITDLERNIAPLYRHAQPAKGLELAGWQFKSVNGDWLGLIDEHGKNQAVREGCEVREVFAMADGVNERDQVRSEHAEWSQATFGNAGPIGPLKHLSKEALEAAAEPGDLSEWADMQFLLWDAQRRAGITDEQITQAMIDKLAVNKQRSWPEPKDGEPRLHIKDQPAPVVPDDVQRDAKRWRALLGSARIRILGSAGFDATAHPGENPDYRHFGMEIWTHYPNWLHEKNEYGIDTLTQYADAMLAAAPHDNPALNSVQSVATMSGGWIPVSERMPETDGNYWGWWSESKRQGPVWFIKSELQAQFQSHEITHWMPLPAAPQEAK